MAEITAAGNAVVPVGRVMRADPDVHAIRALSIGRPVLACYLRAAICLVPCALVLVVLAA